MKKFELYLMAILLPVFFLLAESAPGAGPAYEPGKVLVKFDPGIIPADTVTGISGIDHLLQTFNVQSSERAISYSAPGSDLHDRWWVFNFPEAAPVQDIVIKLRLIPGVTYAEVYHKIILASTPNDMCYPDQWSLAKMNVPAGWDLFPDNPGSSAVTVAVIDSGILTGHNEFTGRLVSGYNFVNKNTDVTDQCGHGTKCAGMVGANWNGFQMAGMDAQCKIRPVKVFGLNCSSNFGNVIDGILWAKDLHDGYKANVLSLSFGYPLTETDTCTSGLMHDAILQARAAGCIIVVAAHNYGIGQADMFVPACFDEVITVASIDDNNNRSIWHAWTGFWESSTGESVDVAAPAGRGCATANHPLEPCQEESAELWLPSVNFQNPIPDSCSKFSGTSAATPQVAGICALLYAKSPTILTHDQAKCLLIRNAHDQIGPPAEDLPGRDDSYGWGLVDLYASIQGISGPAPAVPQLLLPGNNTEGHLWSAVTLDWQESANPGIYDYSVWREDTMELIKSGQGLYVTEALITGLRPGTWYRWQILAKHCMGTSESVSEIWRFKTIESPYIEWDSFQQPVEVSGDHDANMEEGEIWRIGVTIRNSGSVNATAVTATLDGDVINYPSWEPLIVYNNASGNFGSVAAGAFASLDFLFMPDPNVWYGIIPCGKEIQFNLTTISATPGPYSYPPKMNFFQKTVGKETTATPASGGSVSTSGPTTSTLMNFSYNDPLATYISYAYAPFKKISPTPPYTGCVKLELLWKNVVGANDSMILKNYDSPYPPTGMYDDAWFGANYSVSDFYRDHLNGDYSIRISKKSSCAGSFGTNNVGMGVTQSYPGACDSYSSIAVLPALGSTAGGTWIDLYGPNGAFQSGVSVYFDMATNVCPLTTPIPAEEVQRLSDNHLKVRTPPASGEVSAAIGVDNPTQPDFCLTYAFGYKTLAFTANQGSSGPGSQSVSIVDTAANGPFAPRGSMPVDATVVPMSMVYNEGNHPKPGRRLYVVDYGSGNLEYYDAANFTKLGIVALQSGDLARPGAFDIAFSRSGAYAFVTHITDGRADLCQSNQPCAGGVSVLAIGADGTPTLVDADPAAPDTPGAPAGITRLPVPVTFPDAAERFYPLSARDVMITDNVASYTYRDKERYPGEYVFLSGIGAFIWHSPPGGDPICPRGEPCYPDLVPRRAVVAVIDNNKCLYCDPAVWGLPYCDAKDTADEDGDGDTDELLACLPGHSHHNTTYWQSCRSAVWDMGTTLDGIYLGDTAQALGFSLTSGLPPTGPQLGPTVYMLNKSTREVYLFNYDKTSDGNVWSLVMADPDHPENSYPFTIPTGPNPTDVKVQRVQNISPPPDFLTLAYITNAGDDTVTVVNTATNTPLSYPQSPIQQDLQCQNVDHNPTSFDTRSNGNNGYSSDLYSNTVSVFDLPNSSMPLYPGCKIDVGQAPIRIVVQPVPGYPTFFGMVRNELAFAQPGDFTTPSKQSNLIRDWEDVNQFEQTSANPQAVISNINALQTKVSNWVTNAALKSNLTEGINLYRSAYIFNHPTLKQ